MLRTVGPILLISGLLCQFANGDEIRRKTFVGALLGIWAPASDGCEKSRVVISEAQYSNSDGSNCSVQWIVETAGVSGTNYAVHASCVDPTQQTKTKTVNLIIRRQGDGILIGNTFNELKPYQRCPSQ